MRMLGLQIKYDIRQGILQQWKKFVVLGVVYIACIIHFIIINVVFCIIIIK